MNWNPLITVEDEFWFSKPRTKILKLLRIKALKANESRVLVLKPGTKVLKPVRWFLKIVPQRTIVA